MNDAFKYVQGTGNVIGIVSDNRKNMVISALRLFGLRKFVNLHAFNVKLWEGYCPKHKMVADILQKAEFKEIGPESVYWFDDKEYSKEALSIGVNFIKVGLKTNVMKVVKELVG